MAFLTNINAPRPKFATVFKWVALIFLVPLIVLAIAAIVITSIAQLPVAGQLMFVFLGGVFASAPIVRRSKRQGIIIPLIMMVGSLAVIYPLFEQAFKGSVEGGVYELLLAFTCGFVLFWGAHKLAWRAELAFRKQHHRLRDTRSEEHKKTR